MYGLSAYWMILIHRIETGMKFDFIYELISKIHEPTVLTY